MEYTLINPINPNYSALEQVLTNRGINIKDIPHYLNLTKEDVLSPTRLDNIDKAIKMLSTHLARPEGKIFVVVDCDYDGFSSASYLLNYIYEVFPSTIDKITYGFHDGKIHGIEMHMIPERTTLVIAPDSSSSDYEIHQALSEKGIDVLCLDHHQAERVSEYACVVNNQLCDYPNKTLSGVGIVYKMCQRIDELLGESHANNFLDLVATGLIADMMDIRNMETRYLIQEGLRQVRNPYLKGMVEKNAFQLKDELTPMGVAFYIVPYINSITRVGTQEEKRILFDSMLEWKAYNLVPSTKRGCKGQEETIVEQAIRTCFNAKSRQTRLQDASVETIEEIIKDQNLLAHKLLLIRLRDVDIDPAIRGLIANKLVAKYQRPVAILGKTIYEGKVAWMGSARGYEKSKMKDFRQFCLDSGLVFQAAGHQNAFGLGIYDQDFDSFLAYSDEVLKDIDFSPSYKVDFIYTAQNLNPQDILDLGDRKDLWGQAMDQPLVAIEHIPVTENMVTLMSRDKNPTLKIQLSGVSCIKFKSSEEEYESFLSKNGAVIINLVGKTEVNKYYNSIMPQIIIQDYKIVDRRTFYF